MVGPAIPFVMVAHEPRLTRLLRSNVKPLVSPEANVSLARSPSTIAVLFVCRGTRTRAFISVGWCVQ